MNEKNTSQLKNYALIIMGLVISLAGIIYIVVQYSKLLSDLLIDNEEDENEAFALKIRSHFKQMHDDEGVSPDLIDDGDLSVEL